MSRVATRRPNHDHHLPAQQPHGDNVLARFAGSNVIFIELL
jgi:hypothetical protein